jgi:hypothetical protein
MRVLALLFLLVGVAHAAPASDFELWSELDLSAQLGERWSLLFPFVARNSAQLSNPQLVGEGAIVSWRWTERVQLNGGYLVVSLPNTGRGFTVQAPLAAVTFGQRIGRFRLSDRNRAERLIGVPRDPFRYRNRFVVDVPIASEAWRVFAADEVFYDFTAAAWTQNRFQVGAGRRLSRKTALEVYYLERSLRHAAPGSTHALGLTLEVRLR